jgi:SnoaL-like domain
MAELPINDVIELEQVLAKYAVAMTQSDVERVTSEVFASGGTYSAFGSTYQLADFPALVEAAPKGLFLTGTPVLDLDVEAGTGTGEQPLLFIDQTNHHMRMGWYSDTYVRTDAGWRLKTRSMTFLRRSGAADHGKAHDPLRPEPTANPAS